MPGPFTFGVTSPIKSVSSVINTDVIALFAPFGNDGKLPALLTTDNCLFFPEVGDITVGGDSVEQTELDLNRVYAFAISTKVSQGQVSFGFRVDPDSGPPTLPAQQSVNSFSPQGVLWIGKYESTAGTAKTYKKWGEFPANFDHANDISWPRNNAQTANAVFHITGEGKMMGFESFSGSDGTILVTETP